MAHEMHGRAPSSEMLPTEPLIRSDATGGMSGNGGAHTAGGEVTRPQIAAIFVLTLLALVRGCSGR